MLLIIGILPLILLAIRIAAQSIPTSLVFTPLSLIVSLKFPVVEAHTMSQRHLHHSFIIVRALVNCPANTVQLSLFEPTEGEPFLNCIIAHASPRENRRISDANLAIVAIGKGLDPLGFR